MSGQLFTAPDAKDRERNQENGTKLTKEDRQQHPNLPTHDRPPQDVQLLPRTRLTLYLDLRAIFPLNLLGVGDEEGEGQAEALECEEDDESDVGDFSSRRAVIVDSKVDSAV